MGIHPTLNECQSFHNALEYNFMTFTLHSSDFIHEKVSVGISGNV